MDYSVDTVTKLQIAHQRSEFNPSMKFYSYNCANTEKACIIITAFYECMIDPEQFDCCLEFY